MSRFEPLGMQQDATQEIEAPELDVDFLDFRQLKQEVSVQISEKALDSLPQTLSLFAVSNKFGYFVALTSNGVVYGQLAALRQTFASSNTHSLAKFASNHTIPIQSGHIVQFIKISASQSTIIIATTRGGFAFYSAKDVSNGNYRPSATIDLNEEIKDVQPNPGDNLNMVAVLNTLGLVKMISIDGQGLSSFGHEVSSICWSARGKQIACGTGGGQILQFTPDGQLKNEIPRPPSLQGQYYAADLQWLENTVFFCVYNLPPEGSEHNHAYEVFILARPNNASPWTHVKISDPVPAFGLMDRTGFRHIFSLKNFQPYKHLLIMGNGPSADLGLIGNQPDAQDFANSGGWLTVMPPETSRMTLGVSKFAEGSDVCPIGLAVDLTASAGELSVPGEEGQPSKYPDRAPIVLAYTNDGIILAWWACQNGGPGVVPRQPYADMVTPIEFDDIEEAMGIDQSAAPAVAPAPTFGSSFGVVPALPKTSSLPAFGQSTFGKQSQPAFGQSGFGSTPRSSFAAPSLGQTAAPTFGNTSSIGSNQPVFGSRTAMGASQPTFGNTSALESSTFGSTPSKPTFGSTSADSSATPTFGSTSALGSSPTPTFGGAATLGSTNKIVFGSNTTGKGFSGFASASSTTSPFAQHKSSTGASPFGSATPIQSSFASASDSTPFGQSSFAAGSPFAAATQTQSSTTSSTFGIGKISMPQGTFGGMRDSGRTTGSDNEAPTVPAMVEAKDDEMSDADSDGAISASWATDDDPLTQQFKKVQRNLTPPPVKTEAPSNDGLFGLGKLGLGDFSKPPSAVPSSEEKPKPKPGSSRPLFGSPAVELPEADIPKGFFGSQPAMTTPLKSPALSTLKVEAPMLPSPAPSTGSKNFPFGNIDSVDKPFGASIVTKSTPSAQHPTSSVSTATKPNEPVPSMERVASALENQFINLYVVMRDELGAVRQKIQQSAGALREAGTPSERLKAIEDFAIPSNWTFGDIPLIFSLTQQLVEDSKISSSEAQELKKSVKSLQAELLKGEAKRSEVDRYLRAKVDAGFGTLVKERPLGPEQAENQQRLTISSRLVNQRLEHLEENIRILRSRSVALQKNQTPAFKAPSLDTIKRSIRNISTAVQEQTNFIDDMLAELNTLRIGNTPPAHRKSPFLVSRSNGTRNGQRSLSDTLKVAKLNAVHTEVTVDIAKVAAASLNKERFGQMLKAVWEAGDIRGPIINNMAAEQIRSYNVSKENSIPPLDIKVAQPLVQVEMQQSPKLRKPVKEAEIATPLKDEVKIESPPASSIPNKPRNSVISPSPSLFAASNDVPMPTRSMKPTNLRHELKSPVVDTNRDSIKIESNKAPTQSIPPPAPLPTLPTQQTIPTSPAASKQTSFPMSLAPASNGATQTSIFGSSAATPLSFGNIRSTPFTNDARGAVEQSPSSSASETSESEPEEVEEVTITEEKESKEEEAEEEEKFESKEEAFVDSEIGTDKDQLVEDSTELVEASKDGPADQVDDTDADPPAAMPAHAPVPVKIEEMSKADPADSMLQKGGLWSFKPSSATPPPADGGLLSFKPIPASAPAPSAASGLLSFKQTLAPALTPAPALPASGGLLSFKPTAAPLQPAGSDFKFNFGNFTSAPRLTETSHSFAPFAPFVPAEPVEKSTTESETHRSAGAVRRQLRANRGKQSASSREDSSTAAPSFGIIDFAGEEGSEDDDGEYDHDGEWEDEDGDEEGEIEEGEEEADEGEYSDEQDPNHELEEGEEIDDPEEHILSPVEEDDEEDE